MASLPNTPRGPRLLCLHGFCQNGAVLRAKTHALRKELQRTANASLVFLDAPHVLPPAADDAVDAPSGIRREKRTWWRTRSPSGSDVNHGADKVYEGFDESLQAVSMAFEEHGGFDGVLGFSQGAVFAHLVCAAACGWETGAEGVGGISGLKFGIMVAGFPTRDAGMQGMMEMDMREGGMKIPSLHVWGRADTLVPPEGSEKLSELFEAGSRECVVHDGGHVVPQKKEERKAVADFVIKVWNAEGNFGERSRL